MIEALVALTISSGLVLMVGALFLVQNNFYAWLLVRSQVQENARSITEVIGSEIRSVARGGVILADSLRVVFRAPMVSGVVCGVTGQQAYVHVPGGSAAIVQNDVAAIGALDPVTGAWTYYDATWAGLTSAGGAPAVSCEGNGADTTDASSEFMRLKVGTFTGSTPAVGNVVMLLRKSEFKIGDSLLDPGLRALFMGNYGATLTEFATGLDSDARFEFRRGSSTYYKSVTGGNLNQIDGIRVVAESVGRSESGGTDEYEFGWTIDIPLRNAY